VQYLDFWLGENFFQTSKKSDFFKKSDFWLILTIQKIFVFNAKSVLFNIVITIDLYRFL